MPVEIDPVEMDAVRRDDEDTIALCVNATDSTRKRLRRVPRIDFPEH